MIFTIFRRFCLFVCFSTSEARKFKVHLNRTLFGVANILLVGTLGQHFLYEVFFQLFATQTTYPVVQTVGVQPHLSSSQDLFVPLPSTPSTRKKNETRGLKSMIR